MHVLCKPLRRQVATYPLCYCLLVNLMRYGHELKPLAHVVNKSRSLLSVLPTLCGPDQELG